MLLKEAKFTLPPLTVGKGLGEFVLYFHHNDTNPVTFFLPSVVFFYLPLYFAPSTAIYLFYHLPFFLLYLTFLCLHFQYLSPSPLSLPLLPLSLSLRIDCEQHKKCSFLGFPVLLHYVVVTKINVGWKQIHSLWKYIYVCNTCITTHEQNNTACRCEGTSGNDLYP